MFLRTHDTLSDSLYNMEFGTSQAGNASESEESVDSQHPCLSPGQRTTTMNTKRVRHPPVVIKTEDTKTLLIPEKIPNRHFPCVAVVGSIPEGIMEAVMQGIDETGDDVLWGVKPENDSHNVSATVFLGGERISISVHLFATQDEKTDNGYFVLLQALCHGGYGWNFFIIWDSIVMELKANSKTVGRFIPQIEDDPAKVSKQPSLSEQLRNSQLPAQNSTASNLAPANIPELTEGEFARPESPTVANLLRCPISRPSTKTCSVSHPTTDEPLLAVSSPPKKGRKTLPRTTR
eukprot:gb/GECG01016446.1/.p1 GENE.gb/GECG01016446.1/~~gb/GECG01016446.1/.p1  ORF type:complete len:291 (+),score=22.79 gb/GECG01016446.1/:1-873(+)